MLALTFVLRPVKVSKNRNFTSEYGQSTPAFINIWKYRSLFGMQQLSNHPMRIPVTRMLSMFQHLCFGGYLNVLV